MSPSPRRFAGATLVAQRIQHRLSMQFPTHRETSLADISVISLSPNARETSGNLLFVIAVPCKQRHRILPSFCVVRVRSKPMWVLIYIFSYSVSPAATADKAEWRLLPSVVFQEFTSEKRCKDAKSRIETTLKQAGDKLRSGLEDLQKVGKADPGQIIIAYSVECLPK
jgi:hypothetical protein